MTWCQMAYVDQGQETSQLRHCCHWLCAEQVTSHYLNQSWQNNNKTTKTTVITYVITVPQWVKRRSFAAQWIYSRYNDFFLLWVYFFLAIHLFWSSLKWFIHTLKNEHKYQKCSFIPQVSVSPSTVLLSWGAWAVWNKTMLFNIQERFTSLVTFQHHVVVFTNRQHGCPHKRILVVSALWGPGA